LETTKSQDTIAENILKRLSNLENHPHDTIALCEEFSAGGVSEADIREARGIGFEYENVELCFSVSAACAGLVKLVQQGNSPKNDTILVNLTGADRPQTEHAMAEPQYLKAVGDSWELEDPTGPRHQSIWPTAP
jgi:threonine synthase